MPKRSEYTPRSLRVPRVFYGHLISKPVQESWALVTRRVEGDARELRREQEERQGCALTRAQEVSLRAYVESAVGSTALFNQFCFWAQLSAQAGMEAEAAAGKGSGGVDEAGMKSVWSYGQRAVKVMGTHKGLAYQALVCLRELRLQAPVGREDAETLEEWRERVSRKQRRDLAKEESLMSGPVACSSSESRGVIKGSSLERVSDV